MEEPIAHLCVEYTRGDYTITMLLQNDELLFRQITAELLQLKPEEISIAWKDCLELSWRKGFPDPRSVLYTKPTSTLTLILFCEAPWQIPFDDAFAAMLGEEFYTRCRYLREEVFFRLFVHGHKKSGYFGRMPTPVL